MRKRRFFDRIRMYFEGTADNYSVSKMNFKKYGF